MRTEACTDKLLRHFSISPLERRGALGMLQDLFQRDYRYISTILAVAPNVLGTTRATTFNDTEAFVATHTALGSACVQALQLLPRSRAFIEATGQHATADYKSAINHNVTEMPGWNTFFAPAVQQGIRDVTAGIVTTLAPETEGIQPVIQPAFAMGRLIGLGTLPLDKITAQTQPLFDQLGPLLLFPRNQSVGLRERVQIWGDISPIVYAFDEAYQR